MNDLLFELGTEELPSSAVLSLAQALAKNLTAEITNAGLTYDRAVYFATPRRLAVLVYEVMASQPSQTLSRRGPSRALALDKNGQPLPALLGFAKSCGVLIEELITVKTDKGEWYAYESVSPGLTTAELLPSMISKAVSDLPMTKPMRWGEGNLLFARPVHWAVLLLGDEVIEAKILGVKTGRQSYGHRFHHPDAVVIPSPRAYVSVLKDAFVIADFSVRRQLIVSQVEAIASSHHFIAMMPDSLVDEVTAIVEWPVALLANFKSTFLAVPAEALIAALQSHQKCFALRDKQGKLLPHFITVANINSEKPSEVILGNEKVVQSRLSDAAFFYHQDKRQTLSDYSPLTAKVVFQAKLGTLEDKAIRVQALMDFLSGPFQLSKEQARRAAELCKCDLMTGMVNEFPDLQGLMGYYYALNDGENDTVALALNEQYMPRFAQDALPSSSLGLALSLADRIDTLVGMFAIGHKPTGVKDPFKLRRHALAMIRLLLLNPAPLRLTTLIHVALKNFGKNFEPMKGSIDEIKPFILERLPSFYQAMGIASDLVQAVLVCQDDWLFDMDKRIQAFVSFRNLPAFVGLAAACKRVNHLLQHVSKSTKTQEVNQSLLTETAEIALYKAMQRIEHELVPLYVACDYQVILMLLADLCEPIDVFFEQVMVMVEDPMIKANRLNLLTYLQRLLLGVADLSLLP